MSDYLVYINVTAPYKSGLGHRTVWRGKARVNAAGTEQAIRSQSFESIGKTVIHSENKSICVLGAGWEIHINCPGDKPHCKACGAVKGHPSNFCRDCTPTPKTKGVAVGSELAPRYKKLAQNALKPMEKNTTVKRRLGGKRKRLLKQGELDLDKAVQELLDEF